MSATKKQQSFQDASYMHPRLPLVNIEFQDLSYCLQNIYPRNRKKILHSMNGQFCAGELTAILGPSGSGKTTLLKVLAGYTVKGVTGEIYINGEPRQMKHFHKISAYIMQDDLLQPLLTVNESMMAVARLKLGDNITLQEKQNITKEVLHLFRLDKCGETRMECLSGGERRRLSIALEMINNPPVILLDEPTSGLDTVAIKQCINVLRALTGQGRTVICTIHQPSPTVFQQFNQVYFIANGFCVYNGSPSAMIRFLSNVGLECPTTHSPAEYIMEIDDDYIPILVEGTKNGKINKRECLPLKQLSIDINKNTLSLEDDSNIQFPVSFFLQFYIIFTRMLLESRRNKIAISIQLFHHIFVGVLIGIMNLGIGNNGEEALSNYKLCLTTGTFFLFTHIMTHVLLFPPEIEIVRREYFNRWYSLKAYFLAMTLRNLPLMGTLSLVFLLITYFMTDQPLDIYRFMKFSLASSLIAICSETMGLALGSIFTVKNGLILAWAVSAPSAVFSIYGMGFGDTIGPFMKFLMNTNYLRCGLTATMQALFQNRPPLECNDIYCHFAYPNRLLKTMGMLDTSYSYNILVLVIWYLVLRICAFFVLRYRLTSNKMD